MKMTGAIFDMDGTLLDSMYIWEHVAENYLKEQGITPPEDIEAEVRTFSYFQTAVHFINRLGLKQTPQQVVEGICRMVDRYYEESFQLKEYAREYLDKLQRENIKMCILTASQYDHAIAALTRLNILQYFDFVMTCDIAGMSKDEPEIYIQTLQKLGTDLQTTIVFEDSLHCIEAAKNAGFLVVGIYDGFSSAHTEAIKALCDRFIFSFKELCSFQ